ncbi:S8 family serine peptidase [candidate division TA06 bacterium]|nr:S8 family serine peptidase [candidate division TA06 bacterium]
MKKILYATLGLIITSSICTGAFEIERKVSGRLWQSYIRSAAGEQLVCWIKFKDKGGEKRFPVLSSAAEKRRAKAGRSLSYGDLPVNADYLRMVKESGGKIRVVSSWLNSVSGQFTKQQLDKVAALDCVERIDLVSVFTAPSPEVTEAETKPKAVSALDYGYAGTQIKLLRINELHDLGYTGAGIRILIIDTGFDRLHQALLSVSVLAERDFQRIVHPRDQYGDEDTLVWRPDSITSFEYIQDTTRQQTQHGTAMLSIVGANMPGTLIGSAYNADFVLAKTEKLFSYNGTYTDIYQEEDWWVAALQWGDSMGVDIATSSLAYRQWGDTTFRASYTYSQMNGEVAFCSQAADSAVSRGIVVLNANGNVSSNTRPDTCIVAPADAKNVISVGGVWPTTQLWASPAAGGGTATGPTADSIKIKRFGGSDSAWIRRIKPDIASAWLNAFANNMDTVSYSQILNGTGTSGATALTAGLCALLLEAHPTWGPKQVMDAIKYSGSNRYTVETYLAHPESIGTGQSNFAAMTSGHRYYIDSTGTVLDMLDAYRIGWGIPDGVAALNYTGVEQLPPDNNIYMGFQLYPNAPNPVNNETIISYRLPKASRVSLGIYNILGQPVRRIDLGIRPQGSHSIKWDGCDANRSKVSSGVYLYRLVAGEFKATGKMLIVR